MLGGGIQSRTILLIKQLGESVHVAQWSAKVVGDGVTEALKFFINSDKVGVAALEFAIEILDFILCPFTIGDIPYRAGDQDSFFSLERAQADFDGKLAPVFVQAVELEASAHGADPGVVKEGVSVAGVISAESHRDQDFDWLVQHLFAAVSEQLLELSVDENYFSFAIYHHDGIRGGFEKGAKSLLSLLSIAHFARQFAIDFLQPRSTGEIHH